MPYRTEVLKMAINNNLALKLIFKSKLKHLLNVHAMYSVAAKDTD